MYSYVGWIGGEVVIRHGISLVGAYRLVKEIGRGAIFRWDTVQGNVPVWPKFNAKHNARLKAGA